MKKHTKIITLCASIVLLLVLTVVAVFSTSEEPTEAEALLATIAETAPTLSQDGKSIILPTVSNSEYAVSIYGTSNPAVISKDGDVYTPLVDTEVGIMYKVSSIADSTVFATDEYKEAKILIKGKYTVSASDNSEPQVLPKLREWKGTTGTLTVTQSTRIVVTHSEFIETAELAAKYIEDICGFMPEIVFANEGENGDIVVSFTDSDELGAEGYTVEISDKITIGAYGNVGALYGMTTIAQMLDLYEGFALPCGYIRDYPQFAVRSVMLDVARHYVPFDYLVEMTKYMAYFKMNVIHVHINDNGGQQNHAFRLESKKFPEINSNLDGKYYTQEEYRNYQKEMLNYGIKVVTEIDSPGHAGFVNLYDKTLTAPSSTGVLNLSTDVHSTVNGVEYTYYDKAVEFMKELFDEFLGGENPVIIPEIETFHIGMDEYTLNHEQFKVYMKEMTDYVKSYGKISQVWSSLKAEDLVNPPIDNDVVVNYWGFADFEAHIEKGFPCVANRPMTLYVVPGGTNSFVDQLNIENLYTTYDVADISTNLTLADSSPLLRGAEAAFWNDKNTAASMQDIFERLHDQMLLISEKSWYGRNAEGATAENFMSRVHRFEYNVPLLNPARKVEGNENGEVAEYDFENVKNNVVKDNKGNYDATINGLRIVNYNGNDMLGLDGTGYLSLPFAALGYPYTVSFELIYNNSKNGVLFSGESGEVILDFNGTGKIAIKRELQTFTFSHVFEEDVQYNIMIVCDMTESYLYVNGIFDSKATIYDIGTASTNAVNVKFSTLVLPTEKIGAGVKGKIDNIKLWNVAMDYDKLNGLDLVNYGNVALNKEVTGSGVETTSKWGYECGVDGIIGTDDCNNKTSLNNAHDAWYQIDLANIYEIDKIVIDFCQVPTKYKILTSVDGVIWDTVYEETAEKPQSKCVVTVELDGVKARYVKYQTVEMFTAGNGWPYSGNFHEIMVYSYNIDRTTIDTATELLETVDEVTRGYLEDAIELVNYILDHNDYNDAGVALKCLADICSEITNDNAVATDIDRTLIFNLIKAKKDSSIYSADSYKYYNDAYRFAIGTALDLTASEKSVKLYSDRIQTASIELIPPATYETNMDFDNFDNVHDGSTATKGTTASTQKVGDYILIKYTDSIVLKSFKISFVTDSTLKSATLAASTVYVSYDGEEFVPVTNLDILKQQQHKNIVFGTNDAYSEIFFPTALTNVVAIKVVIDTAKNNTVGISEIYVNHVNDFDTIVPGLSSIDPEDYTTTSFKYFRTYTESMAITRFYLNSIGTLHSKYLVKRADTALISSEIERLKAIGAEGYTAYSYAKLGEAIAAAEKFLNSANANTDIYSGQKIVDSLQLAEQSLVTVVNGVDTAALEEAAGREVNYYLYTLYSYKSYSEAVNAAKEYLESGKYTQAGVDRNLSIVNRRYNNLVKRKTPENIALNKDVEVSGLEVNDGRFAKEFAVDGVETKVNANKVSLNLRDDAWLTINLGKVTVIDKIDILWYQRSAQYKVQVSTDNKTWTDVSVELYGLKYNNNVTEEIYIEGGIEAQYVRFQNMLCFIGNPEKNYIYCGTFYEIRVFESDLAVYTSELEAVLDESKATDENTLYGDCANELGEFVTEAERVLALDAPTQSEIDAALAGFKYHTALNWIDLGNKHSFNCECGAEVIEEHTWDDGVAVDNHNTKYTCTVCNASFEENDYVKLTGARLNIDKNLNMVYTFTIDEAISNVVVTFEFMGDTYTAREIESLGDGKYAVTFKKIMPQYMNENIIATVTGTLGNEEIKVNCGGISVKEYLRRVIVLYADDAELVTLASDILVYGAASQIYANHDVKNLATDGVDIQPTEEFVKPESILEVNNDSGDFYFESVGLNLSDEVNLYVTFTTNVVDGLTVKITINGREETFVVSELIAGENGRYRIDFNGIMAHEFGDEIVATFYLNGENTGNTLSYSVNSYVAQSDTDAGTALAKLIKATYNYGLSSKAYKESKGGTN